MLGPALDHPSAREARAVQADPVRPVAQRALGDPVAPVRIVYILR
jgi:hypothetical protein